MIQRWIYKVLIQQLYRDFDWWEIQGWNIVSISQDLLKLFKSVVYVHKKMHITAWSHSQTCKYNTTIFEVSLAKRLLSTFIEVSHPEARYWQGNRVVEENKYWEISEVGPRWDRQYGDKKSTKGRRWKCQAYCNSAPALILNQVYLLHPLDLTGLMLADQAFIFYFSLSGTQHSEAYMFSNQH